MFASWVKLVRVPRFNRKSKQSVQIRWENYQKWRFEVDVPKSRGCLRSRQVCDHRRRRSPLKLRNHRHFTIDKPLKWVKVAICTQKAWLIRLTVPAKLCSTFAVNEKVFDFNATLLRFSRKIIIVFLVAFLRPHCASNFEAIFLLRRSWLKENPFFVLLSLLMTYFSSSCFRGN